MVNILNLITIGEKQYLVVDKDPATEGGLSAEIGSMAVTDEGGVGKIYIKNGASDTAWDKVSTASDGGIALGDYLKLPIYNTSVSGQTVDDVVQQNGYDVSVAIASQGTRSAAIAYVIPNPGDAISSADFVLSEGDQEINGNKTFNDDVVVDGSLTVNGTLTYLNSTNTEITDKAVVLNKGGAAASAGDSGLEFEENASITGWLKMSSDRAGFDLMASANSGAMKLDGSLLSADRTLYAPDADGVAVIRASGDDGAQYQVPFYNDANKITSSPDFVYHDSFKKLSLGSATSPAVFQILASSSQLELNSIGLNALSDGDILMEAFSGQISLLTDSGKIQVTATAGDVEIMSDQSLKMTSIGNASLDLGNITHTANFNINFANSSQSISFNDGDSSYARISSQNGPLVVQNSSDEFIFQASDQSGSLKIATDFATGIATMESMAGPLHLKSNDNFVYFYDSSNNELLSIGSDDNVKVWIATDSAHQLQLEGQDIIMRTYSTTVFKDSSDADRLILDLESSPGQVQLSANIADEALVLNAGGSAGKVRFSAQSAVFYDNQISSSDYMSVSSPDGSVARIASINDNLVLAPQTSLVVEGFGVGILHSDVSGVITSSALDLTADVGSSILPVANGGTNSSAALNNNRLMISSGDAIVEHSALTEGQLMFPNASGLPEGSADLFWDNNNSRLGIGTNLPARELDVTGDAIVRGTFRLEDAAGLANKEFSSGAVSTTDNSYHVVQSISIPTDKCVLITAHVVGRRTGGSAGSNGDSAVYIRTARVKNVGGTVTIHNLQSDYTSEEPAQSLWDGTMVVSGTNVQVQVRGATNNNVSWHCWSEVQVQG